MLLLKSHNRLQYIGLVVICTNAAAAGLLNLIQWTDKKAEDSHHQPATRREGS